MQGKQVVGCASLHLRTTIFNRFTLMAWCTDKRLLNDADSVRAMVHRVDGGAAFS
jgi:hypothetical protein